MERYADQLDACLKAADDPELQTVVVRWLGMTKPTVAQRFDARRCAYARSGPPFSPRAGMTSPVVNEAMNSEFQWLSPTALVVPPILSSTARMDLLSATTTRITWGTPCMLTQDQHVHRAFGASSRKIIERDNIPRRADGIFAACMAESWSPNRQRVSVDK
jgi:hypothetical protein